MEEINVATNSLENATRGIIQGFIQDDINQEVMSLQLENVDAKSLISKLASSVDPLLSETKELLSKVVKNNISRINSLQTQIGDYI